MRHDRAGDRPGRVGEDDARHAVQAGDIRDRGQHHEIGRANVRRDVAGQDGGDEEFRHTEWQGTKCRRSDRRSRRPADADRPGDHARVGARVAAFIQVAKDDGRPPTHRRDRLTTVGPVSQGLKGSSGGPGDFRRRDVVRPKGHPRFTDNPGVNEYGCVPVSEDLIADERRLLTLGIQGRHDGDRAMDGPGIVVVRVGHARAPHRHATRSGLDDGTITRPAIWAPAGGAP